MTAQPKRDFSAFHEPMTWDERLALIHKVFPQTTWTEAEWNRRLGRDDDLTGRILAGIAKEALRTPGRPGPRPALDQARAGPMVDEWLGRETTDRPYTLQAFPNALATLMRAQNQQWGRHRGHSVRQLATKTGLQKNLIWRFLSGELPPSADAMERVASAYGKQPSYFLEYRIGAIATAIVHRLTNSPEQSISNYERLFWMTDAAR